MSGGTALLAIGRRELMAYLLSPVGALVAALFLFFTALVHFVAAPALMGTGFAQGQPASLRLFFQVGVWVFFVVGPAISMRTLSEEFRLGTIESLLTAPVTEAQIILGKFLGAMGFLVLMLVPTLIYVVALEQHGRPDYGELFCGYLGLLLVGGTYLASGILASTATSSQVLAYLGTIFFWLILLMAAQALPLLAARAEALAGPEPGALVGWAIGGLRGVAAVLEHGNPVMRTRGFVIGLLDSFNVVFFFVFTVVFLMAAIRGLKSRRWT